MELMSMKFYRYEAVHYYGGGCKLYLRTFDLIKETPCGYWIGRDSKNELSLYHERRRWVSKTARKRFAYPTKEEAIDNFIARKHRQIEILRSRKSMAEQELYTARSMKEKDNEKDTRCH